jgi:replicative DNA helicase
MSIFFNHEAEKKLLGAIVLAPDTLDICGNISPFDFHLAANRSIMAQIRALSHAGKPVDLITLSDAIRCNGGGATMAEVAEITDGTPSAANAAHYLGIVKDCALRRAGWEKSTELRERIKIGTESGAEALSKSVTDIQAILDAGGGHEYRSTKQMVPDFVDWHEDVIANPAKYDGVKTGFSSIDEILWGLHEEFIVIGARPSIGKTTLILNFISNIGIRQKIPCAMFSIEMSERSLVTRLTSSNTKVWAGRIKGGILGTEERLRIADFCNELYDAPLIIDDDPGLTLDNLRIRARRMIKRDGAKIIFIDHFSKIKHKAKHAEKRYENFIEVSNGLKQITREFKIPVVLLCQIGRDSEGREPVLSDLRETGSLEEDADIVGFLHRKRQTEVEETGHGIETDLIIAKNRDGKCGRAKLLFLPDTVQFIDAPKKTYKGEGK